MRVLPYWSLRNQPSLSITLGNGIFSVACNYLPNSTLPSHRRMSPGMQPMADLSSPAPTYNRLHLRIRPAPKCGRQLCTATGVDGEKVVWRHFGSDTHEFSELILWSDTALKATGSVGVEAHNLVYEEKRSSM